MAAPVQHGEAVIRGAVVKGRQLGRTLGYPTANVALGPGADYRFGVYATVSHFGDGGRYGGVANIGCNPTTGLVEPRLEVFLFDFDEDIYGETLETTLVGFIRPELKFADVAALVDQIGRDVRLAKQMLLNHRDAAVPSAAT